MLRDFRVANPDGTWDAFKTQPGNEAVFDCLAAAQGHICAYCEIQISRGLYGQVEHYRPKSIASTGRNPHLDLPNLLGCCEGGTWRSKAGRSEDPIEKTMHCGALKLDKVPDGQMVDPRRLSASCLPWRVTTQGHLVVDQPRCTAGGVDPELAERTLTFLGLNRRVLVRLREAAIARLLEDYVDAPIDPELLLPDSQGQLQPFWSTVRSFAGSEIESFIAANIERIPGLRP